MFLEHLHRLSEAPLPSPLQKQLTALIDYCESLDPDEVDGLVLQTVAEATVIIGAGIIAYVVTRETDSPHHEAILASLAVFLSFLGVDLIMLHSPKNLDAFMRRQIFITLSHTFPFTLLRSREEPYIPPHFPWDVSAVDAED